ncbi:MULTISPECIES: hypothetical protein [Bradyrhizobium]|uniref:hypothetical protein n=1 Tax=Bradyrhizobium TaxID=374 RepID=UPI00131C9915|nr:MULTISPECIES: hypothetical protein [Bradyrhizobium]UFW50437.1 hypothetical protein BaraCB756_05035 [Bradyrhizobium arachidis]
MKVLIVEDEFFIALDAEEQVKSLGHTVVGTAVSAEQAVRIAGEEKRMLYRWTSGSSGRSMELRPRWRFDLSTASRRSS